ncbi:unnamed protein product (macronuclear) [Paramecium tetraurelia]|uniref:Uncharacterized protein n=1 Tax=Paramecium tetraurelia TaxID=5888 RepID=A0BUJ3_PARTE|nr:uncharacterized protein GSPATT00005456001 [Paramecium tetraurelia]CAK62210.1 unnamed protein product [Paramecium tetraurelia]|eukprot:XP_001429608.1 hypothetical protein (macronuclear) [Paramecium tetraurelia strain d4-2]
MISLLLDKKEHFRKEIRRQKNETIFKQKRALYQQPYNQMSSQVILNKIQKFEYCDELFKQIADMDNPPKIIKDLVQFLSQTQSLETIKEGLRCLNNQLYYFDDFDNQENEIFLLLQKYFQNDDYILRKRTLMCLGNLLYNCHQFIIPAQNIFFKEELLHEYSEEYSFVTNFLTQFGNYSDIIKSIQFLSEIIMINPNDMAFESVKSIFENCTPLDADELIEQNFILPSSRLLIHAKENKIAYEALLAILNKANDSTKIGYYQRGLNQLITYFLDHPLKKEQGFQLMLYFVSKFDDSEENLVIDSLFSIFEGTKKLHQLLMQDCNPMKLLIICNSIENGSMAIFKEFLDLNIISNIFIPYLSFSDDHSSIQIIISAIDSLLQRDEMSGEKFQYVKKAFNNEQFRAALERNIYNVGDRVETNSKIDSILNILNDFQ